MRRNWPAALVLALAILPGGLVVAQPSSPVCFGWDDLRTPATALLTGASNPPSRVLWRDDGAGSVGTLTTQFGDQSVEGNEEQGWGTDQLPHLWLEGQADYEKHVHWNLEDATSCNARFCFEYNRDEIDGPNGDDFDATTLAICADCPSGGVTGPNQYCEIGTIDLSDYTISSLIGWRFYRNSSHTNDTCNSKAANVHTTDSHYRVSRVCGSRTELDQ